MSPFGPFNTMNGLRSSLLLRNFEKHYTIIYDIYRRERCQAENASLKSISNWHIVRFCLACLSVR